MGLNRKEERWQGQLQFYTSWQREGCGYMDVIDESRFAGESELDDLMVGFDRQEDSNGPSFPP